MNVYAIDNFSDARPNWRRAFLDSNASWTNAPGPQVVRTTRAEQDTWVFFEDSTTGRDGLIDSDLALAWNCDYYGFCTYDMSEPMLVKFSSIKMNRDTLPNSSSLKVQGTFAHEMGHALGLRHSSRSTELMYKYENGVYKPQTSYDVGIRPPCSGSSSTYSNSQAGLRCVYNWK